MPPRVIASPPSAFVLPRSVVLRRLGVAAVALALVALVATATPAPARPATGPRTAVIVQADDVATAVAAIRDAGGTVTRELDIVHGAAATVPAAAVARIEAAPGIRAVTPDSPVKFLADHMSYGNGPKHVLNRETNAETLHAAGVTGRGVRVALIDTGISPVRDLAGRIVPVQNPGNGGGTVPCVDFSGEGHCDDSYGHGTFIAGLIAGNGASSAGVYKGAAPAADLVSLKIAGRDGSADVSKVLAAIQWVVSFAPQYNIKVLNLSLGTDSRVTYRIDPLNLAVERAWVSGITVVVSAGNLGPEAGSISKPADDPLVITVGAIDDRETPATSDDRLPRFSSRGPTATDGLAKPDLVAPGGRVVSLKSPGSYVEQEIGGGIDATYRRGSGTSMAAGVVSGLAALISQDHPDWGPNRIKFALMSTAVKVAETDPMGIGQGLANVYAASRNAPAGVANGGVTSPLSDGSGTLDGSRGTVRTTGGPCTAIERLVDPECITVHGSETAQGRTWDGDEYRESEWTGSSWYESQWAVGMTGSSWYGSSWYGSSWYGSSWYGSSWYGSSWYGSMDDTWYGKALKGSSWYGAWI